MVTILFSVGLRCSLPPVLFLLLCAQQGEAQKLKALTQTSRQSVFMIDLPTKSFFKTCKEYSLCAVCARTRVCVCVPVHVYLYATVCKTGLCSFLAVHVQDAGCWNPSTANYPNTINQNRCFNMLNAVT